MPGWLKLVLGLVALGIVGIGLLVGGVVWWASKNQDRLREEGQAAQSEGEIFGRTHTNGQCVEEAGTGVTACGAINCMCEARTKIRRASCMAGAKDDGGCKGV